MSLTILQRGREYYAHIPCVIFLVPPSHRKSTCLDYNLLNKIIIIITTNTISNIFFFINITVTSIIENSVI